MNTSYYQSLARECGYGDPKTESLWGRCPEEERLAIIRHLLKLRMVRDLCDFEDDFVCPKKDHPAEFERLATSWSKKTSPGDLPLSLEPFVFFALNAKGFSLATLEAETDRFFWHPDGTFIDEEE